MTPRRHWPSASDEELVGGARHGAALAFEELYRRFRAPVTRQAARILGSRHPGVDDVVQDVFYRAFLALRHDDERKIVLLPWLLRVTHNRCIDELRSERVAPWEPGLLDRVNAPAAGVVSAVASRQALREMMDDIRALPPRQREALLAVVVHGRSHLELASESSATVPASKALVNRARATLMSLRAARTAADRPAA